MHTCTNKIKEQEKMDRREMITRIVAAMTSNSSFKDPTSAYSRENIIKAAFRYIEEIDAALKPIEEKEAYNKLTPGEKVLYDYEFVAKKLNALPPATNNIFPPDLAKYMASIGYANFEKTLPLLGKALTRLVQNGELTTVNVQRVANEIVDKLKEKVSDPDFSLFKDADWNKWITSQPIIIIKSED